MGSQQQFCLRWNNHQGNMVNVFDNLLSSNLLVDVTLACEGASLKAHKVVLSACSSFFQDIFVNNPCKHPVIILKDMKYSEMKAILQFMYKGEVNVSQDQLSALLKTAEALQVKGLAEVTSEQQETENTKQLPSSSVSDYQQSEVPIARNSASIMNNFSGGSRRRRQRKISESSNNLEPKSPKIIKDQPISPSSTPCEPDQNIVLSQSNAYDHSMASSDQMQSYSSHSIAEQSITVDEEPEIVHIKQQPPASPEESQENSIPEYIDQEMVTADMDPDQNDSSNPNHLSNDMLDSSNNISYQDQDSTMFREHSNMSIVPTGSFDDSDQTMIQYIDPGPSSSGMQNLNTSGVDKSSTGDPEHYFQASWPHGRSYCPACSKYVAFRSHQRRHFLGKHSNFKYSCEFCHLRYSQETNLITHKRIVHLHKSNRRS